MVEIASEDAPEGRIKDRLMEAVRDARKLAAEFNEAQDKADQLKIEMDIILRERIPDIMDELGIETIKLTDGAVVSLKTNVFINTKSDAAFGWLEQNGFAGLIKTDLIVSYGRDRIEDARKVAEDLQARGEEAIVKTHVHPQTLKSWAGEQIANARPIPEDHFSTSSFVEAKIKERK